MLSPSKLQSKKMDKKGQFCCEKRKQLKKQNLCKIQRQKTGTMLEVLNGKCTYNDLQIYEIMTVKCKDILQLKVA